MRYDLVQGDLEPALADTLSGGPLASGGVLYFVMQQVDGATRISGLADIDDATQINVPVHYQWQTGDTAVPGVYRAQWQLAYSSGSVPETWPSDDTLWIVIRPRL